MFNFIELVIGIKILHKLINRDLAIKTIKSHFKCEKDKKII